jgi:hypothetical protein
VELWLGGRIVRLSWRFLRVADQDTLRAPTGSGSGLSGWFGSIEVALVHSLLRLTAAVVCILLAVPSILKAEYDRCEGLVQVGEGDRLIIIGSDEISVCRVWTYSKTGSRIFAKCLDGSMCRILLPLKSEPGARTEQGARRTIVDTRDIQRIER